MATKQSDNSNVSTIKQRPNSGEKKHKGAENLKPFPKGVSGNPAGRPKSELSLISMQKDLYGSEAPPEIVAEIEQFIPKHWARPISWLQAQVLRNTIKSTNIKQGDRMAQLMWEMLEGKATIRLEENRVPPIKKDYDLSKLSVEELRLWRSLMVKAMTEEDESE